MRLRRSASYGVRLNALTVVAESGRFLRQPERHRTPVQLQPLRPRPVAANMAGGSLEIVIRDTVIGILGSTTLPAHPPSSGMNIDATPPKAAIRNAGETICSMRDQRR